MCRIVLQEHKNADRIFYSDNAFGYIGSATAYYTDDFSFCYSVDTTVVNEEQSFKELLIVFDKLQMGFNSFSDMKKKCETSKRRLYSPNAFSEYGYCYESDYYKYFIRVNPIKTEINFKIFVYKKEGTLCRTS